MDEKQRKEAAFLRSLSSQQAADWLIKNHDCLPMTFGHRSWTRDDQFRLARHYCVGKVPFVSAHGYELFLTSMSVRNFVTVMRECLTTIEPGRFRLFRYYIVPVLRAHACTEKNSQIVQAFIKDLDELAMTSVCAGPFGSARL